MHTCCPLFPEEIVQLLSLGLAVSCKTRHLSRAAGEVAALAAGGGLFEHGNGLAGKPHYPLPGLKARPLPEGIGVYTSCRA